MGRLNIKIVSFSELIYKFNAILIRISVGLEWEGFDKMILKLM